MEPFVTRELVVKNMICSRCLKVVREDLESLGVEVLDLKLGKLKLRYQEGKVTLEQINTLLKKDDFEIVKDKNELISESVKLLLIALVNNLPIMLDGKLSDYLANKLHMDYWSLSKVFSKTEGVTIERYFILLKIEKAKELIQYGELNFSEIAYELGYRNLYHLSGQFKQITGMSMRQYKQLDPVVRCPLNKIL